MALDFAVINDNGEHKKDPTRIRKNYARAVATCLEQTDREKPEMGVADGARVLGKALHYVSDQTEPDSRIFKGFRERAQSLLRGIAGKGREQFFEKVERLRGEYRDLDPRDDDRVTEVIAKLRGDLEKGLLNRVHGNRTGRAGEPDRDKPIWDYLAAVVAVQNRILESFLQETAAVFQQVEPPANDARRHWIGGRWEYWVTHSPTEKFGPAWFEIGYVNGSYYLKATHCSTGRCQKVKLVALTESSVKISFNDRYLNELEARIESPGNIVGTHVSPLNPTVRYRENAGTLTGSQVRAGAGNPVRVR